MSKVGGANLISLLILSGLQLGESHSWLHCLDYQGDIDDAGAISNDEAFCKGRPRGWSGKKTLPLGLDLGRDNRPGGAVPGGLKCMSGETTPGTSQPMAQVWPGKKIWVTWPAKNHAATQQAGTVELFLSSGPGAGDDFKGGHIQSVTQWASKYPGLQRTFSNCIPNKSGVDRAPCRGEFQMPDDLQKGVYSVMWWWEFNPGEFYNSCADINVIDKPAEPRPTPRPRPRPRPNPCAFYTPQSEGMKAMSTCPGENNTDCSSHHECCGGGTKCYYKGAGYAGCLTKCPPDDDPSWDCTDYSPAPAPIGIMCDGDNNNNDNNDDNNNNDNGNDDNNDDNDDDDNDDNNDNNNNDNDVEKNPGDIPTRRRSDGRRRRRTNIPRRRRARRRRRSRRREQRRRRNERRRRDPKRRRRNPPSGRRRRRSKTRRRRR